MNQVALTKCIVYYNTGARQKVPVNKLNEHIFDKFCFNNTLELNIPISFPSIALYPIKIIL